MGWDGGGGAETPVEVGAGLSLSPSLSHKDRWGPRTSAKLESVLQLKNGARLPQQRAAGGGGGPPGFIEARKGVGHAEAHPVFPGLRTKPCRAARRSENPKRPKLGPPRPRP